ncbi:hypothetical protein PS726_05556 [Pseudomonas fluorescens]|nr:hypothetical protein PS861_04072 [Pseudomonas fluorescens]VVO38310.1 hypothetical protein PS726_05556 [Pseudomonas fluorescens]
MNFPRAVPTQYALQSLNSTGAIRQTYSFA